MISIPDFALLPLPVAVPMASAALLLVIGHFLPKHVPDALAALVALFSAVCCATLAARSSHGPITSWFGGWVPRDGLTLGISFSADRASASVATFISLLFSASFVFSWGYFNKSSAHYHVLMLLFLAAMVGFTLTHDLFNLFVWFEVMSVTAFALTGFKLESQALGGAMNFTVTNSIAGYLILSGIGLVYARTGALDFSAMALKIAALPDDPVTSAAFCLIACGLLIKAAMVPFHFWLADAHAVAPSPVCVMFSGAMVALGIFGVTKLIDDVFTGSHIVIHVVRLALLSFGALGAIFGGLMALAQRHLKRLLAFSTISHAGIMLVGAATVTADGTLGMLTYVVGHGLIKGALFMVAGILLSTRAAIDEINLRGAGRNAIWPAGIVLAVGGLLLAGLPIGILDVGLKAIDNGLVASGNGWVFFVLLLGSAMTGGAVLRATGRIFLGLGVDPGIEANSSTDDEHEKADRPFWLMILPAIVLAALQFLPNAFVRDYAESAIGPFFHPDDLAYLGRTAQAAARPALTLRAEGHSEWLIWGAISLALMIAGYSLSRDKLPGVLRGATRRVLGPIFHGMDRLHSGLINDYVAWIAFGLAAVVACFVV